MSNHSYIFRANFQGFGGEIEIKTSSSKSYKCSNCKTVFVVRSDDRLDDDNVYCDK